MIGNIKMRWGFPGEINLFPCKASGLITRL